MKIGYGRTSTWHQEAGLAAQRETLTAAGCEEIFQEQVSSVELRPQLEAAIRCLRKGDVLVVTKLDRFARSVEHAICLERKIAAKGAALLVLDPGIDTGTAVGRLMFGVLGSVAQFEREIMLERQRDGIARAQADGKYRGRAPTARAKAEEIERLLAAGVPKAEIARRLRIGRTSVFRVLGERREALAADRAEAAS
jgi:DNA invertase Pin-like site-specific DNA recombinase